MPKAWTKWPINSKSHKLSFLNCKLILARARPGFPYPTLNVSLSLSIYFIDICAINFVVRCYAMLIYTKEDIFYPPKACISALIEIWNKILLPII